jgi:hypothetical protein
MWKLKVDSIVSNKVAHFLVSIEDDFNFNIKDKNLLNFE